MSDKEMVKVIFQPSGRRGEVEKGTNIIEASRQLGVDIEALCGETKVCGKCKVRIEEGSFEKYGIVSSPKNVSPWLPEEDKFITADEKASGHRLGCVAEINDDILVFVPEESRAGKQVVSKAARDIEIKWNPSVKLFTVSVEPPKFDDPTGDFERVARKIEEEFGVKDLDVDLQALRSLPVIIRKGEWQITVAIWNDKEMIKFWPGEVQDYYGMGIDIGTTTVAAYFCNMRTMEVMDTVSMMNPQCKYGEDVMARITYHMQNPGGLARMSADIVDGLNGLVQKACEATHPPLKKKRGEDGKIVKGEDGKAVMVRTPVEGVEYLCLEPEDLVDIALGCNTAMHHILLQLDPEFVGLAPFPPVIHRSLDIKARDLGLNINKGSYIFVLPNEAGFVGADNVCVLVAEQPHQSDKMQLIIDIGTNGELVLGNKHKLISSSCATGPALEGAQLSCGMRAAPGAIERITIDRETHDVDYKVIGRDAWRKFSEPKDMKTKGICGSGILDVLAELYSSGVIVKSGRFSKEQKSDRFRKNPDNPRQKEFVIAWADETSIGKDVVITQKDIRQIQLGKGALYTGCKLMMRRMNIEKLDTIKIAGAFGSHVDREKALIMGLFPDCEIEMVQSVGNAAGDGARVALLNRDMRDDSNWIARNVEYIELTVEEDFEKQFMESMQIPHMTDKFPHLEGIVPDEVLNQK